MMEAPRYPLRHVHVLERTETEHETGRSPACFDRRHLSCVRDGCPCECHDG